ncbi:MAG: hypothetical protein ABIO79_04730 [Ferruginibacter sp.]
MKKLLTAATIVIVFLVACNDSSTSTTTTTTDSAAMNTETRNRAKEISDSTKMLDKQLADPNSPYSPDSLKK